jgi:hypothetical protein
MGRWIVIISLAMAQCPDLAAAAPPTTDVPLPKQQPARLDHPAPAVKIAAAPRVPPSPGVVPADISGPVGDPPQSPGPIPPCTALVS